MRSTPAPDTTHAASPPADNSTLLYEQAYADYMRGRYDVARQGFLGYLKQYPTGDRAGNAQYWIGECYYDQNQFANAQVEFQKVLTSYPQSDKAPAAMFKIAKCLDQTGDKKRARSQYQSLIQKYPNSQEAKLAADLLR
jgi:tol-pal system protein YbgF